MDLSLLKKEDSLTGAKQMFGHQVETLQFPTTKPHNLDIWMEQCVQRPTKFFILCLRENSRLAYFNNPACIKSFEKTL